MTPNQQKFQEILEQQYTLLFAEDKEYAYVSSRFTPKALAEKMTKACINKGADIDGQGVVRTCKAIGISHTHKSIYAYLGV